ncbi:MAG: hypothetical protein JNM91_05500 [Flavobacteriales bacterium]|nr:hypothetical protein [Flavobacteriales bacterium]
MATIIRRTHRSAMTLCALGLVAQLQGSSPSRVDSLIRVLPSITDARHRLDVLVAICSARDTDGAYAQQAVHLADSLLSHSSGTDTSLFVAKGDALWQYAYLRYDSDPHRNSDSAFHWYQLAAEAYARSGHERSIAFANTNLAQYLVNHGRAREAVRLLKNALPVHLRYANRAMLVKDHGGLGRAYYALNDLDRSLDNQLIALRYAEADLEGKEVGAILHNIGIIYQDEGLADTAIAYYGRAITAFKAHGDAPTRWLVSLNNMIRCHMEQGNLEEAAALVRQGFAAMDQDHQPWHASLIRSADAELRLAQGDAHGALISAREAASVNDLRSLVPALVALSDAQLALNDTRAALRNAERAEAICDSTDIALSLRRDVARVLSVIWNRTGPPDKALLFLQRYAAMQDSVRNEPVRKRLAAMDLRKQERADSLKAANARLAMQADHADELHRERQRRWWLWAGSAILAVGAVALLWRLVRVRRDKAKSDHLVGSMLPQHVADELKRTGRVESRELHDVTVLFTDFVGFTSMAQRMSAQELHAEVDACFAAFDRIVKAHGGERIKTIGDAYMAAGGLGLSAPGTAARMVHAALAMQEFIIARSAARTAMEKPAFAMRVGLHTGSVIAGVVGVQTFQYDIWGDTVNTASRMESSGEVGQVNISEATYRLLVDGCSSTDDPPTNNEQPTTTFTFTQRGKVQAKGKGEMEMYFVHQSSVA